MPKRKQQPSFKQRVLTLAWRWMNAYWNKPEVPENPTAPPPEFDEFYLHIEETGSIAVENVMRRGDEARREHNEKEAKARELDPDSVDADFCGPIVTVAVIPSMHDRYIGTEYAIVSLVEFLDLLRSDCWCRRCHLESWEADWMEERQEMKSRHYPVDIYRSSQARKDDS